MKRTGKSPRRSTRPAHLVLEEWLERSRTDPAQEPAFFRRLLDATVYVHVPAWNNSGNLRLVQFRHPDGFDAIPLFSSPQKAQVASSRAVRIVALRGRDLLNATRGATLMINPNDGGAVLYPEEISCLLDTGFLARVERVEYAELHVRPAHAVPNWLEATVRASVQAAGYVVAVYILEAHPTGKWDTSPGLVIYLVVDPGLAERAARLVATAIQPLCSGLEPVIDVMTHDVSAPLPHHLTQSGIVPVFNRSAATDMRASTSELTRREKGRRIH